VLTDFNRWMLVRYDLAAELRNADAKGYGTPVDMPIVEVS